MAVTAQSALSNIPYFDNINYAQASATGNINPGDWLAYSGQYVVPTNSGHTAYWKASGAGVAMDSNPTYDQAGRSVQQSAFVFMAEGAFWVTAAFSGEPGLGVGAYPITTGSGVYAVTGLTGVGSTWQTAQTRFGSALSGTANAQQPAVATVIGSRNFSNAGTGELLVRLMALPADVRG